MNEMFLLKLGEIVLKGGNRFQFENRLKTNVARRMRPFGDFRRSTAILTCISSSPRCT